MDIAVTQAQGRVPVVVLRPSGDLDASNYRTLIAKSVEVYNEGARNILLDLSDVPYMSSSGLVALHRMALLLRGQDAGELSSGWEAMRAMRRDLDSSPQPNFKLLNPNPDVSEALDISGFRQFLEIHTDFQAAVDSF
jgi:anti-anti-sigma factor